MGKVKKSKSGIVCILANYGTPEMRKVCDFKVTSGYPTVTIPSEFKLVLPQLSKTVTGYQHITIPPDLNAHITGQDKQKIWSVGLEHLVTDGGHLVMPYHKILTVVFPPISSFPVFTDRSYAGGAMLLAFSQMPHWNENTSYVLEIFAQQDGKTVIPQNEHYSGDQGTYMPWRYKDMGKTYAEPHRQGEFFIRPFAITNHDHKATDEMTVYFGNY